MLEDNTNNYNEVNQGIDRITNILKQQSTPRTYSSYEPQAVNLPDNILNMLAYSNMGTGKGGNFAENVQSYMHTQQTDQLNQQQILLNAYEAKLKMGDAQAKALDDKLSLFTGNDPEGKALFLQALHDDPEQIDPSNSYQVMTKLAGIAKKTGYQSPDLQLEKAKTIADINLKKAQANATNSLANQRNSGPQNKPLPPVAIKLQNEALDAIGTASNIDADLGAVIDSIDNKQLSLGPADNLISEGRNALGISSKNSRNFATFKTTLEKMRNDSLRLNKGVQTEGDAVRAWNEILQNITDEKLVKQRLQEVRQINSRAAELKQLDIDNIRANYGYEPLDVSAYKKPAAILSTNKEDPRIQQARDAGYTDEEIKQYLEGK